MACTKWNALAAPISKDGFPGLLVREIANAMDERSAAGFSGAYGAYGGGEELHRLSDRPGTGIFAGLKHGFSKLGDKKRVQSADYGSEKESASASMRREPPDAKRGDDGK